MSSIFSLYVRVAKVMALVAVPADAVFAMASDVMEYNRNLRLSRVTDTTVAQRAVTRAAICGDSAARGAMKGVADALVWPVAIVGISARIYANYRGW